MAQTFHPLPGCRVHLLGPEEPDRLVTLVDYLNCSLGHHCCRGKDCRSAIVDHLDHAPPSDETPSADS